MADTPDLADRIAALESAVAAIPPASTPVDFSADINDLKSQASAHTTEIDALTNRLTTVENTVAAISDSFKNFAPETVEGASLAVAEIKSGVNALSRRIFGDVVFPEPPPEPATTE